VQQRLLKQQQQQQEKIGSALLSSHRLTLRARTCMLRRAVNTPHALTQLNATQCTIDAPAMHCMSASASQPLELRDSNI